MIEIERKFKILTRNPDMTATTSPIEEFLKADLEKIGLKIQECLVRQYYLPVQGNVELRIREQLFEEDGVWTKIEYTKCSKSYIKEHDYLEREENEYEIRKEEFIRLKKQAIKFIEKKRWLIGKDISVDVIKKGNENIFLMEIEFPSVLIAELGTEENIQKTFDMLIPGCCYRFIDVSKQSAFKSYNLAEELS